MIKLGTMEITSIPGISEVYLGSTKIWPTQEAPYLYIEPVVVWLADWGASNDVFSNTTWDVD